LIEGFEEFVRGRVGGTVSSVIERGIVYTGVGHLSRARERKDNVVGTIAEPRKDLVWLAILRTA
jgi:hypothetical protein